MKPIDILDALSDLPEEYPAFAVRNSAAHTSSGKEEKIHTSRGGIMMKKQTSGAKASSVRFSRAGIAAAVALCIGLNAALIFGISRMKNDAASPGSASEVQDPDRPYMKLVDAMPTGIMFRIACSAEEPLSYNPQYIVMQDGQKVADCEPYGVYDGFIMKGEGWQQLYYEQLPSGSYTLVNLAEDGETEGLLGHLDFEISAEYDSMIYIPEVRGMHYDEARARLEEMGVAVSEKGVVSADPDFQIDDVTLMELPVYNLTEKDTTNHFDGKGYWVHPGDAVTLQVQRGAEGDPATVPYVVGQDFEAAKITLLELGFMVDKRNAYSDEFPEGTVIKEQIDNADVPETGIEATIGTFVRVTVSLGSKQETFIMPDLVGKDWETAKQTAKELGLLPGKQYYDSQGEPAGTVMSQSYLPGDEMCAGLVVMFNVAKEPHDDPMYMVFDIPENTEGFYYIYVRDEAGETDGVCYPFKSNGFYGKAVLYPDCTADNTKVEAVLVSPDTGKEAVIGSYILHPGTAAYDTVSEDIAEAFRQVQ